MEQYSEVGMEKVAKYQDLQVKDFGRKSQL